MVGRKESRGIHLPTEHVIVEDMLWIALYELGVEPRRSDWEAVLEEGRRRRDEPIATPSHPLSGTVARCRARLRASAWAGA